MLRGTDVQSVQLGIEVTPGVAVTPSVRLFATALEPTPEIPLSTTKLNGVKVATSTHYGRERSTARVAQIADFNLAAYLFSSIFGQITPTDAPWHPGSTARYWYWQPSPIVPIGMAPNTYTVEHGSSRGAEQYTYSLFDAIRFRWDNESVVVDGSMCMQQARRDWPFTPSVALLSAMVCQPINVSVWVSTDGVSWVKMVKTFNGQFVLHGLWEPVFHLINGVQSFDSVVERAPEMAMLYTWEESSEVDTAISNLFAGRPVYVRFQITGPQIDPAGTPISNPVAYPGLTPEGAVVAGTYVYACYTWLDASNEETLPSAVTPTNMSVGRSGVNKYDITLPTFPANAVKANIYMSEIDVGEGGGTPSTPVASTTWLAASTITPNYTYSGIIPSSGIHPPTVNSTADFGATNYLLLVQFPAFVVRQNPQDVNSVYANAIGFDSALDDNFGMAQVTLINKLAGL